MFRTIRHTTIVSMLVLLLAPCYAGAEVLWLSDSRPVKRKAASEHEHNVPDGYIASADEVDTTHKEKKQLWLRRGDDPLRAAYVDKDSVDSTVVLLDRQGNRSSMELADKNGPWHASAVLEELGFYNAYLTIQTVHDGRLEVQTAKAELLRGTCCRKGIEEETTRAPLDPTAPIELVREHLPDEELMTRITSGDRLTFTVLGRGAPLAGVPVTLITQHGWHNTAVSDDQGRVSYTMIRDYYPSWSEFNRRHRETYLTVAHLDTREKGTYEDTPYTSVRYTATLAGHYYPSSADYRSYAYGLSITLLVFTFGGTAIYLYRRRRRKPFKEVRFDGKD